jgi:hypothetical protein
MLSDLWLEECYSLFGTGTWLRWLGQPGHFITGLHHWHRLRHPTLQRPGSIVAGLVLRGTGPIGIYYGMVGVTSAWALLQLVAPLLRFLLSADGLRTGPVLFSRGLLAWETGGKRDPVPLVVSPAWSTISLMMV